MAHNSCIQEMQNRKMQSKKSLFILQVFYRVLSNDCGEEVIGKSTMFFYSSPYPILHESSYLTQDAFPTILKIQFLFHHSTGCSMLSPRRGIWFFPVTEVDGAGQRYICPGWVSDAGGPIGQKCCIDCRVCCAKTSAGLYCL